MFGKNSLRVLSAEDGNCKEGQQNGVGVSLDEFGDSLLTKFCPDCGADMRKDYDKNG